MDVHSLDKLTGSTQIQQINIKAENTGKAVFYQDARTGELVDLGVKLDLVQKSGSIAVAMDVDAAGLPFLQNLTPPAGSKTVEELAQISGIGLGTLSAIMDYITVSEE